MTAAQITYLAFGILLLLALLFDLGLMSRRGTEVTIRKALWMTAFWVLLALLFFGFVWYEDGHIAAIEYLSAYLMEWSLSIDNIFVFILIFNYFGVRSQQYARVLLIGILMAIVLRIAFISLGIGLVERFHAILYLFGAFLVYTGVKMFTASAEEEPNLEENRVYKFLKRFLPLTTEDGQGKLVLRRNGKRVYTSIFVVVVLLATTDIVFALDSIPAVFAISTNRLVVYTSNIFAVLGLRSLFFLLRGAVNRFSHLQQGIAFVLIFIGGKMLAEMFGIHIPVYISLLVIVASLLAAVVYSVTLGSKEPEEETEGRDLH